MNKLTLYIIIALFGNTSLSQSIAEFDSIVNLTTINQSPGYSILVSKGDSIIYEYNIGLSNLRTKDKIARQTKFRIASITKQFTAVCILQLIAKQEIKLSTRANDFLPFLSKKITIEHLLTHTSGLPSYDDKDLSDEFFQRDFSPFELTHLIQNEKMISKPQKEFYYNNTGYHILGYIIEQVSGMSYQSYLQKNIFVPLQLSHTQYESSKSNILGIATGYEFNDSIYSPSLYYSMDQPYSAGSIVSTPKDLLKWNQAIFHQEFIPDSLLKLAHQSYKLKKGQDTFYGYGWIIGELQGEPKISHGGFLEGFNSTLFYLPNSDISVIVLSNCSCLLTDKLANRLGALAIQKPIVEKIAIQLNPSELYKFEGEYDAEEVIITVRIIDNILTFQLDDSEEFKIYPESDNVFFSNELDCTVEFDQNGLVLKVSNRETIGVKLDTTKNKRR